MTSELPKPRVLFARLCERIRQVRPSWLERGPIWTQGVVLWSFASATPVGMHHTVEWPVPGDESHRLDLVWTRTDPYVRPRPTRPVLALESQWYKDKMASDLDRILSVPAELGVLVTGRTSRMGRAKEDLDMLCQHAVERMKRDRTLLLIMIASPVGQAESCVATGRVIVHSQGSTRTEPLDPVDC